MGNGNDANTVLMCEILQKIVKNKNKIVNLPHDRIFAWSIFASQNAFSCINF